MEVDVAGGGGVHSWRWQADNGASSWAVGPRRKVLTAARLSPRDSGRRGQRA